MEGPHDRAVWPHPPTLSPPSIYRLTRRASSPRAPAQKQHGAGGRGASYRICLQDRVTANTSSHSGTWFDPHVQASFHPALPLCTWDSGRGTSRDKAAHALLQRVAGLCARGCVAGGSGAGRPPSIVGSTSPNGVRPLGVGAHTDEGSQGYLRSFKEAV